ncbi:carbohydrate esterase family 4 protein [Xylaria telfairii]|nr:carbohydrate esterase family 4 protein [Xylaria telfairii]
MRLLSTVSLALCAGQTIAHADLGGHYPVPRLAGARKFLKEFQGERKWEQPIRSEHRQTGGLRERGEIEERQNTNGRCGSRYGSCATGYCCSFEGQGADYCESPDCQLNYGSGCDGNQKPKGVDTSTIARPKIGNVKYGGVGIYDCVNDGDIALTFDDGPWNYTADLLDKLAKYQAKATFFITGTNLHKGQINDPATPWPSVIQRMAAEGHQIASHTWSHENYSQLTTAQYQNQIYWNEIALNDILGYFPTYMRPPFSICPTNTCGAQLATLGYHVIYFDLDTEGYLHDDPTEIQISKNIWDDTVPGTNPCRTNYLQIEHDIHYQTVYNLTDYFLTSLFNSGYRSVTVGQCLGDPPENWYRAGSKPVPSYTFTTRAPTGTWSCLTQTSTGPAGPTSTLKVSIDGNCGSGVTCQGSTFGNCCSVNGYCGASIDYCGSGCNAQFGSCTAGDDPLPSDGPIPTGPDDPIPSSTTSGSAPTNTLQVSVDGNCGSGFTCEGSAFGNCCSQYNFCGSTDDYCLDGCQPAFGSGCKYQYLDHPQLIDNSHDDDDQDDDDNDNPYDYVESDFDRQTDLERWYMWAKIRLYLHGLDIWHVLQQPDQPLRTSVYRELSTRLWYMPTRVDSG